MKHFHVNIIAQLYYPNLIFFSSRSEVKHTVSSTASLKWPSANRNNQKDCLGSILWENPVLQILVMAFNSSWQVRIAEQIRICTSSFSSKLTEQLDLFSSSMCANPKMCILKLLHSNLVLFRGFDLREHLIAPPLDNRTQPPMPSSQKTILPHNLP